MRQIWDKFWQDLLPDEKTYYTEKVSIFLLQDKNNKKNGLHYFIFSSSFNTEIMVRNAHEYKCLNLQNPFLSCLHL